MSYGMTNTVFYMNLPTAEKAVLQVLAFHCNDKTQRCDPGTVTLEWMTGLSESTILRARISLRKKGLISYEDGKGGDVSNNYILNFKPTIGAKDIRKLIEAMRERHRRKEKDKR